MIVGLCGFLHLCCTVLKPWDSENCVILEVGIGARISILYYFRLGYTKEDILKTIDPTLDVTLHELLQHYLPPHVIHSELDSYWRFDISMLLCYQFWIFKTNRLRFRFIYINTLFISHSSWALLRIFFVHCRLLLRPKFWQKVFTKSKLGLMPCLLRQFSIVLL